MENFLIFGIPVPLWIYLPTFYFLWVSLLLVVKKIIFNSIQKAAEKSATKIDDIFIKAADMPLLLLIFTSGGVILEKFLIATAGMPLTNDFLIGFKAVTIVAVILFVDRFLLGLLDIYSYKIEILRSTGTIAHVFVRAVVIGLGILILFDSFGISVTPVLASLGIGSLAVALALQPTLENLFSGIQIISDKPIQTGQFVKLDSGEEGYVHRIGWRSTWVRLLDNNVVVIPNKNLVNAKILNYYYPSKDLAVLVEVGVHYKSDLDHVEKVTREVAREVMQEAEGAVKEFEPFIRYHTLGDFSIKFTVIMRA